MWLSTKCDKIKKICIAEAFKSLSFKMDNSTVLSNVYFICTSNFVNNTSRIYSL